jgi:putative Mg2+ transporter-C (MgtC) family protein
MPVDYLMLFLNLALSLFCGFLIGAEREYRRKSAGIATQSLVIGGAMLFAYVSAIADPSSPARISAQIVTGVGFLGAGIILKGHGGRVRNLTTAASIWFAASIGMAIGMNLHLMAVLATIYALVVHRIPHPKRKDMERTLYRPLKTPPDLRTLIKPSRQHKKWTNKTPSKKNSSR